MKMICRGALSEKYKECKRHKCSHSTFHEEYEYCDCSLPSKGLSGFIGIGMTEICDKHKCVAINSLEFAMKKVLKDDIQNSNS